MTAFTTLDYVLTALAGVLVLVGLFRGLSGELGALAGLVAALVAGYLLYPVARTIAGVSSWSANAVGAGVCDFLLALVAFGLVRMLVAKFVSVLIPQPTNAILGALSGAFKAAVGVALLAGIGLVRSGSHADGFFASHSVIVAVLAEAADSYAGEAAR